MSDTPVHWCGHVARLSLPNPARKHLGINRLALGGFHFFKNSHRVRQKGFAMGREFGYPLHPVKQSPAGAIPIEAQRPQSLWEAQPEM